MNRRVLVLLGTLLASASASAGAQEQMTAEEFLASLTFHEGNITLPGGVASLSLPEGFHYLSPEDTERVLVTAWGNPPGNETMGMLLRGPEDVLAEDSWAVVIAYEADGYVSDEDAEGIDYAELLTTMQESSRAANAARAEAGYEEVELMGWAAAPRYDKASNKLYWAKELRFGDIPVNTLNYNVRILGRKGVLVLNLVATMPQITEIESVIPTVLAMTNFNCAHRRQGGIEGGPLRQARRHPGGPEKVLDHRGHRHRRGARPRIPSRTIGGVPGRILTPPPATSRAPENRIIPECPHSRAARARLFASPGDPAYSLQRKYPVKTR
jgi:uncharacterized membrane-anchored protein